MKKYLFILSALFFISSTYAQKTISFEEADSLSKAGVFITVKLDNDGKVIYQLPVPVTTDTYTPPTIDTVFVIMLMCDTSQQSADKLGQVYWDIGYEVRKVFSSFYTYEGSHVQDFDHINYLDVDKKELPKNIIVWQSKHY